MAALSNISRTRSYAAFVFLLGFSFLIGLPKESRAFPVTINTTALNGTAAKLDFVLFDGDLAANNSVTISSLITNGTLQGTDCSVSCTGGPPFTTTDTGGFGEFTQDLILGTNVSFNLTATHNFAGGDADLLVLNLLNPGTNFTLVDTNLDALNAPVPFQDALLVLNLPSGQTLIPTSSTPSIIVRAAVYEPRSLLLLSGGVILLVPRLVRQRSRR